MAALAAPLRRLRPRLPQRPAVPPGLGRATGHLVGAVTPLTPLGWTLLGAGVIAWFVGVRLGWEELLIIAAGCLLAVAIGLVATLRRPALNVTSTLTRQRVVMGDTAVGKVAATNPKSRRVGGARIEVPVGPDRASFTSPALAGGADWDDTFTIPTDRRAVIPVGPAKTVTGDPLGVARRELGRDEPTTLYVHPITIGVPAVSSGWFRDLEGQTTQDLSQSDVAFHTLREYVPGDDRRHVHWRSSAKLGRLMVRQFVDTRRSHVGVILATGQSEWADAVEFEFGVQVVGSIGRAVLDEGQEVTAAAGPEQVRTITITSLLDDLAGVAQDPELESVSLPAAVRAATRSMPDASIVIAVVGSTVDQRELRRLLARFTSDTSLAIITCEMGVEPRRGRLGRVGVLQLGELLDLRRVLLHGGVA